MRALVGRSLTDIHSWSREELDFLLEKSAELKRSFDHDEPAKYRLAGNKDIIVALLFYENSTRTRTSFEVAAMRLGMRVVGFAGTAV